MADIVGPFDTVPWSQAQWYAFAPQWSQSGIVGVGQTAVTAGPFGVTASALSLTVNAANQASKAWVRGAGWQPEATTKTKTATANTHGSLSRRDRLVIRRDLAAQTVALEIIQGTPAGTPTAPALTQVEAGIWEIPVCSFVVPPASGTTLSGFVDEREWLSPVPIAGKMWKTSAPVELTGTPTKIAMGASRVGGGITFDDANDELVLSAAGQYQLTLHGYVWSGSGDGYFAINRKRSGLADLMVLLGDFTKPPAVDKRANASRSSLPLAAGDRLSLLGVGPTGVSAFGTTEFQGCSLEVRYIAPLNGADPV